MKINWENLFAYSLGIAQGIWTFEFIKNFKEFKKRFKQIPLYYEEDDKNG